MKRGHLFPVLILVEDGKVYIGGLQVLAGQVSSAQVADKAITNAKLRDSAAYSVIGRGFGAGTPGDIEAGVPGKVLQRVAAIPNDLLAFDYIRTVLESGGPTELILGSIADGKFLRRVSTSIVGVGGVAILGVDTAVTQVINTTIETQVSALSVPGGTLGTNRAIRLTMIGRTAVSAGVTPTFTVRVKYGATTIFTGSWAPGATNLSYGMLLDVMLSAGGATGTQRARGELLVGGDPATGTASAAPIAHRAASRAAVSEDSTADKTLAVTFQMSASDAWTYLETRYVCVEVLNP